MDESDLRSALVILADRAPDPTPAAAQAHRRVVAVRARRRRAGLVGVAAAVVVAAGTSTIIQRALVTGPSSPAASPATISSAPSDPTTDAAAQPLSGYTWTSSGTAPNLPVTLPIPAGYSASQMKFYPGMDYATITYTSAAGSPPIQVTVGAPEAFAEQSTSGTPNPPTTASQSSPTSARRTVTTADGSTVVVVIDSSVSGVARSMADALRATPSPIDLGIRLAQLPAGGYVAGAQLDQTEPTGLASVQVVWPISDQSSETTDATLTLRDTAGLPPVVGSTDVRTLDGRLVTVYVGADTTSWISLQGGRAVVLDGYPLSGTMLRDALAYPQSTLLPLLAGATAAG